MPLSDYRNASASESEVFGWIKTVGLLRKLCYRGSEKVACMVT